jgi:nitrite reductase/ring-hydroxylating ferredoxin subunit
VMVCGTVQCLWHGSQFDVSTGKVKAGPAKKQIRVYQVNEEHGEVRLVL